MKKVDVYGFVIVVYFIATGGEYPKLSLDDVITGKIIEIHENVTTYTRKIFI